MRPLHKAGEYAPIPQGQERALSASMRPLHKAGEYPDGRGGVLSVRSFNEAPAQGRGIRGGGRKATRTNVASMRPLHKAGEYRRWPRVLGIEISASMRPLHKAGEYNVMGYLISADAELQ